MSFKKFLTNTMTIYRKTPSQTAYGGSSGTWEKKYWNIKCRVYKASGDFSVDVDGKEYHLTNKAICESDVDLLVGDKIEETQHSEKYLVLFVNHVMGRKATHHIEVKLSRINA